MATLECDRYHLSFFGYQSMQNHYVYGSTDGKKKQPRQEDPRLSNPTQMQELPRTAADLQGISQSATLPMLHTTSHRIGGKAETEKEIET